MNNLTSSLSKKKRVISLDPARLDFLIKLYISVFMRAGWVVTNHWRLGIFSILRAVGQVEIRSRHRFKWQPRRIINFAARNVNCSWHFGSETRPKNVSPDTSPIEISGSIRESVDSLWHRATNDLLTMCLDFPWNMHHQESLWGGRNERKTLSKSVNRINGTIYIKMLRNLIYSFNCVKHLIWFMLLSSQILYLSQRWPSLSVSRLNELPKDPVIFLFNPFQLSL